VQVVPYIIPGIPDLTKSLETIDRLMDYEHIPFVEIGLPAYNPYMDGPVIASAQEYLRKRDFGLEQFFSIFSSRYNKNQARKIVLMGYLSDIEQLGLEEFKRVIKDLGISGCVIVGQEERILSLVSEWPSPIIPVVSTNRDEDSLKVFLERRPPFIYFRVSQGKTGEDKLLPASLLSASLEKLKKSWPDMRVFAGFGLKNLSQIRLMKKIGFDGVIVGSVLVEKMMKNQTIEDFLKELKMV
jgi:tryptophan synthase alpha chain